MPFRDIIGQEATAAMLLRNIANGRVAHTYLFHGPLGVGVEEGAVAFAQALLCGAPLPDGDACGQCRHCRRIMPTREAPDGNHPDVMHLRVGVGEDSAKSRITIAQVRRIQERLAFAPLEGRYKVVLVHDAETMMAGRSESANAFLKTLEEPPDKTVIVLLASSATALLDTIRSRSRLVAFLPLPLPMIEEHLTRQLTLPPAQIKLIARLSGGSLGRAMELARDEVISRRTTLLDLWLSGADDPVSAAAGLEREFNREKGQSRTQAKDFTDVLYTLYRDALAVSAGLSGGEGLPLVNADLKDRLAALARPGNDAITRFMDFLLKRQDDLRLNVGVGPFIEMLFIEAARLKVLPTSR